MIVQGYVTRTLYENDNFSIQAFKAKESVEFPNGKLGRNFSIKGLNLPFQPLDVELDGEFDITPYMRSGKPSYTFTVRDVTELKIPVAESILKYLKTLSGIGDYLAETIYSKFGDKTYEVLDNNIEELKKVPGIGEKKFQMIAEDYVARGAARELYTYLLKYYVSEKKIRTIFDRYKSNAVSEIKKNPYRFYMDGYFSFDVAEKIAVENQIDRLDKARVCASIIEVLRKNEQSGNTCLWWKQLYVSVYGLLGISNKSPDFKKKILKENIHPAAKEMIGTFLMSEREGDKTILYRRDTYLAEKGIADSIKRLLRHKVLEQDWSEKIKEAEEAVGKTLSDEQRGAVEMALNSRISIVTGGPGTGKTAFQEVLLYIFAKYFPSEAITLASPTGRAARRMTESSGYEAYTLHRILNLVANDDGGFIEKSEEMIRDGLIIVDEVSMLDNLLADKLFSSVSNDSRIVCVGDVHQLPSVGCGSILKDLIDSGVIPVTRFTKIFRQDEGSAIAINAASINRGRKSLTTNTSFVFIEKSTSEQILDEAVKQYEQALAEYGIDETCVLTPFRKKTVTGVNEMNPVLKTLYKDASCVKSRMTKLEGTNIYKGDKVMFTKNYDTLSNGDVGYVKDVKVVDNVQYATVKFDDRELTLTKEEFKHLVLAYSTTIHKSQGSEFKCCIVLVDPKHQILLQRNLIYTAITRAKEKLILIGDKEALEMSIDRDDTQTRMTRLKKALQS